MLAHRGEMGLGIDTIAIAEADAEFDRESIPLGIEEVSPG